MNLSTFDSLYGDLLSSSAGGLFPTNRVRSRETEELVQAANEERAAGITPNAALIAAAKTGNLAPEDRDKLNSQERLYLEDEDSYSQVFSEDYANLAPQIESLRRSSLDNAFQEARNPFVVAKDIGVNTAKGVLGMGTDLATLASSSATPTGNLMIGARMAGQALANAIGMSDESDDLSWEEMRRQHDAAIFGLNSIIHDGMQNLADNYLLSEQNVANRTAYQAQSAMDKALADRLEFLDDKRREANGNKFEDQLYDFGVDSVRRAGNFIKNLGRAGYIEDLAAEAAGSLLPSGIVAKGVGVAAKGTVGAAAKVMGKNAVKSVGKSTAGSLAKKALTIEAATNALIEGAGGYAQAAQEVLKMDTDTLLKHPNAQQLFKEKFLEKYHDGMSEEEIDALSNKVAEEVKMDIATDVAEGTGIWSGIAGAAGGHIAGKVVSDPTGFQRRMARRAAAKAAAAEGKSPIKGVFKANIKEQATDTLRETAEETLQNGAQAFIQNYEMKEKADEDRKLSADVVEGILSGALGGGTSVPLGRIEAKIARGAGKATKAIGNKIIPGSKERAIVKEAKSRENIFKNYNTTTQDIINEIDSIEEKDKSDLGKTYFNSANIAKAISFGTEPITLEKFAKRKDENGNPVISYTEEEAALFDESKSIVDNILGLQKEAESLLAKEDSLASDDEKKANAIKAKQLFDFSNKLSASLAKFYTPFVVTYAQGMESSKLTDKEKEMSQKIAQHVTSILYAINGEQAARNINEKVKASTGYFLYASDILSEGEKAVDSQSAMGVTEEPNEKVAETNQQQIQKAIEVSTDVALNNTGNEKLKQNTITFLDKLIDNIDKDSSYTEEEANEIKAKLDMHRGLIETQLETLRFFHTNTPEINKYMKATSVEVVAENKWNRKEQSSTDYLSVNQHINRIHNLINKVQDLQKSGGTEEQINNAIADLTANLLNMQNFARSHLSKWNALEQSRQDYFNKVRGKRKHTYEKYTKDRKTGEWKFEPDYVFFGANPKGAELHKRISAEASILANTYNVMYNAVKEIIGDNAVDGLQQLDLEKINIATEKGLTQEDRSIFTARYKKTGKKGPVYKRSNTGNNKGSSEKNKNNNNTGSNIVYTNGILNNFSTTPFTFRGHTFKNAEAAFQFAKIENPTKDDIDFFTQASPSAAKTRGQEVALNEEAWDAKKADVMEEVLRAKFSDLESPQTQALLNTKEATLINPHNQEFWGFDIKNNKGENAFGKILMKIRAELQEQVKNLKPQKTPSSSEPQRRISLPTHQYNVLMEAFLFPDKYELEATPIITDNAEDTGTLHIRVLDKENENQVVSEIDSINKEEYDDLIAYSKNILKAEKKKDLSKGQAEAINSLFSTNNYDESAFLSKTNAPIETLHAVVSIAYEIEEKIYKITQKLNDETYEFDEYEEEQYRKDLPILLERHRRLRDFILNLYKDNKYAEEILVSLGLSLDISGTNDEKAIRDIFGKNERVAKRQEVKKEILNLLSMERGTLLDTLTEAFLEELKKTPFNYQCKYDADKKKRVATENNSTTFDLSKEEIELLLQNGLRSVSPMIVLFFKKEGDTISLNENGKKALIGLMQGVIKTAKETDKEFNASKGYTPNDAEETKETLEGIVGGDIASIIPNGLLNILTNYKSEQTMTAALGNSLLPYTGLLDGPNAPFRTVSQAALSFARSFLPTLEEKGLVSSVRLMTCKLKNGENRVWVTRNDRKTIVWGKKPPESEIVSRTETKMYKCIDFSNMTEEQARVQGVAFAWGQVHNIYKSYGFIFDKLLLGTSPQGWGFGTAEENPFTVPETDKKHTTYLSESTKEAINARQNQETYIDGAMLQFTLALGRDGMADYLGINLGNLSREEEDLYNIFDLASKKGKYQSVITAYNNLRFFLEGMFKYIAAKNPKNTSIPQSLEEFYKLDIQQREKFLRDHIMELPVRWRYFVSSMGRFMIQGGFQPQSNKITCREIFLTKPKEVDVINNPQHREAYFRALAQAFGTKVQRVTGNIDEELGAGNIALVNNERTIEQEVKRVIKELITDDNGLVDSRWAAFSQLIQNDPLLAKVSLLEDEEKAFTNAEQKIIKDFVALIREKNLMGVLDPGALTLHACVDLASHFNLSVTNNTLQMDVAGTQTKAAEIMNTINSLPLAVKQTVNSRAETISTSETKYQKESDVLSQVTRIKNANNLTDEQANAIRKYFLTALEAKLTGKTLSEVLNQTQENAATPTFKTAFYLEADGIASGASNAMRMLSTNFNLGGLGPSDPRSAFRYLARAGMAIGLTGSYAISFALTAGGYDIYGQLGRSMEYDIRQTRALLNRLLTPTSKDDGTGKEEGYDFIKQAQMAFDRIKLYVDVISNIKKGITTIEAATKGKSANYANNYKIAYARIKRQAGLKEDESFNASSDYFTYSLYEQEKTYRNYLKKFSYLLYEREILSSPFSFGPNQDEILGNAPSAENPVNNWDLQISDTSTTNYYDHNRPSRENILRLQNLYTSIFELFAALDSRHVNIFIKGIKNVKTEEERKKLIEAAAKKFTTLEGINEFLQEEFPEYTIDRAFIKQPLTQSQYGAGLAKVAECIVTRLEETIHSELSEYNLLANKYTKASVLLAGKKKSQLSAKTIKEYEKIAEEEGIELVFFEEDASDGKIALQLKNGLSVLELQRFKALKESLTRTLIAYDKALKNGFSGYSSYFSPASENTSTNSYDLFVKRYRFNSKEDTVKANSIYAISQENLAKLQAIVDKYTQSNKLPRKILKTADDYFETLYGNKATEKKIEAFLSVRRKGKEPISAEQKDWNKYWSFRRTRWEMGTEKNHLIQSIQSTLLNPLQDHINNDMYGPDYVHNKNILISTSNIMALLAISHFKKMVQALMQHSGKFITTAQYHYLEELMKKYSTLTENNILTNYRSEALDDNGLPMEVAQMFSMLAKDFTSLKQEFGDKAEQISGMPRAASIYDGVSNDTAASPNIKMPSAPGVAMLPKTAIGMGESIIMSIMALYKSAGIDVFDGFNMNIADVAELGRVANLGVYDAWQTNVWANVGKAMDTFFQELSQTKDINDETISMHDILSEFIKGLDISLEKDLGIQSSVFKTIYDLNDFIFLVKNKSRPAYTNPWEEAIKNKQDYILRDAEKDEDKVILKFDKNLWEKCEKLANKKGHKNDAYILSMYISSYVQNVAKPLIRNQQEWNLIAYKSTDVLRDITGKDSSNRRDYIATLLSENLEELIKDRVLDAKNPNVNKTRAQSINSILQLYRTYAKLTRIAKMKDTLTKNNKAHLIDKYYPSEMEVFIPIEGENASTADILSQVLHKANSPSSIGSLLTVTRTRIAEAEQRQSIKNLLFDCLSDTSYDNMGGAARSYTHERDTSHDADLELIISTMSGGKDHFEPIENYSFISETGEVLDREAHIRAYTERIMVPYSEKFKKYAVYLQSAAESNKPELAEALQRLKLKSLNSITENSALKAENQTKINEIVSSAISDEQDADVYLNFIDSLSAPQKQDTDAILTDMFNFFSNASKRRGLLRKHSQAITDILSAIRNNMNMLSNTEIIIIPESGLNHPSLDKWLTRILEGNTNAVQELRNRFLNVEHRKGVFFVRPSLGLVKKYVIVKGDSSNKALVYKRVLHELLHNYIEDFLLNSIESSPNNIVPKLLIRFDKKTNTWRNRIGDEVTEADYRIAKQLLDIYYQITHAIAVYNKNKNENNEAYQKTPQEIRDRYDYLSAWHRSLTQGDNLEMKTMMSELVTYAICDPMISVTLGNTKQFAIYEGKTTTFERDPENGSVIIKKTNENGRAEGVIIPMVPLAKTLLSLGKKIRLVVNKILDHCLGLTKWLEKHSSSKEELDARKAGVSSFLNEITFATTYIIENSQISSNPVVEKRYDTTPTWMLFASDIETAERDKLVAQNTPSEDFVRKMTRFSARIDELDKQMALDKTDADFIYDAATGTTNQGIQNIITAWKLPQEQVKPFIDTFSQVTVAMQKGFISYSSIYEQARHILNKLTLDMCSPSGDMQEAAQRYNLLLSLPTYRFPGNKNRSFMVPALIALNAVSPEMRQIMSNISAPSKATNAKNLDEFLRNVANNMLYRLEALMAKSPANFTKEDQALLDQARLATAIANDSYSRWMDRMPTFINRGLTFGDRVMHNALFNFVLNNIKRIENYIKNAKMFTLVARYIVTPINAAASSLLSAEFAEWIASSSRRITNSPRCPKPVRELWFDIVNVADHTVDNFILLKKKIIQELDAIKQRVKVQYPAEIRKWFDDTPLSDAEWKALYTVMARSDLSCLDNDIDYMRIARFMTYDTELDNELAILKAEIETQFIKSFSKKNIPNLFTDMDVLSEYLVTQKVRKGNNALKRNSFAVLALNAMSVHDLYFLQNAEELADSDLVKLIDKYVSLNSIKYMKPSEKLAFRQTFRKNKDGIIKIFNMLKNLKNKEKEEKLNSFADQKLQRETFEYHYILNQLLNFEKGYLPTQRTAESELIIASLSAREELENSGYMYVGEYQGTNLDPEEGSRAYYYRSMSAKGTMNEGALHIVQPTFSGISKDIFYSEIEKAGVITAPTKGRRKMDPAYARMWDTLVAGVEQRRKDCVGTSDFGENLVPVYGVKVQVNEETGEVDTIEGIIAFEERLNPEKLAMIQNKSTLPEMIGNYASRQQEESMAEKYNMLVGEELLDMYQKASSKEKGQFVNILDITQLDKVERNAVSLIPWTTKELLTLMFKSEGIDGIYVRRDLLKDVIGYRSATAGDIWTGISNYNLKPIKDGVIKILGKRAYKLLVGGNKLLNNAVSYAKSVIVIRTLKTVALNSFGNLYHLNAIGVSMQDITQGIPLVLKELEEYNKSFARKNKLEVAKLSTQDPDKIAKLEAQIELVDEEIANLEYVSPIIHEYGLIQDIGTTTSASEESAGVLGDWVIEKINKLPPHLVKMLKYANISKDTPIYQVLEKATMYGDFIAKAILLKHLQKNENYTLKEAVVRVNNEFIPYQINPGRLRSFFENSALIWFFNYKLRGIPIALRTLREHPLRSLILLGTKQWVPFFGDAGNIVLDSMIGRFFTGSIWTSIGWGQLLRGLEPFPLLDLLM